MPAAAAATRRPYQDQLQVPLLPPLSVLRVSHVLRVQRVEGGAEQCQQEAAGQTGGQEAGAAGGGLQDHRDHHNYNSYNHNSFNINNYNYDTDPQHHSSCGGAAEW